MRTALVPAMLTGALLALSSPAGADEAAAAVARNCTICHAPPEAGQQAIPHLDPLTAEEIEEALMAFVRGEKHGTIMPRIVKGYDEPTLRAVARELGQRP